MRRITVGLSTIGIAAFDSTGTTEAFNTADGNAEAGFYIGDSPQANATLFANSASGNGNGFFVRDAENGSIVGNSSHGNCVGILFLADAPGPAGAFNVVGNSIRKNNRACPKSDEGPAISGIGVALVGANDVSVHLNAITQNTPGGDTPAAGGVVVGIGDGGTQPMNNHVQNNLIVKNQVDIAWDGTGSGNVFAPNVCGTTAPAGLC